MNQPAKKRRRFSFSLSTLMAFMLVMCLLFGRVQQALEQQAFLKELEAAGWSPSFTFFDTPEFWELVIDRNYIDCIGSVRDDVYNSNEFDLTPLVKLKNLQKLKVANTQVTDLSPLVELKNLRFLILENTQLSDLTQLAKLKNIQCLFVANTQVMDLTPLTELKKLQQLGVSKTQVSDLTPLMELINLQGLNISNTQVSDL